MWEIETTTQYERDLKWYDKKHPSELAAVLRNLDRYFKQLIVIGNATLIEAGYIHHEPHGVVAIDQKGGGKALQETRLYAFANMEQNVLYLITIGNKDTQKNDIAICNSFVESIRFPKETP